IRSLFPLDHFDRGERAYLVEGPLDAMWLHQHGHASALATLGSNITRQQIDWLRGNVTAVTLVFDNDEVGWRATDQLIGRLSQHGFHVSVVRLPSHVKDVQELSADEIEQALSGARSALELKLGV
ncbi:hypothetical protein LCGC14_2756850, partial [marine sediment metagenome]